MNREQIIYSTIGLVFGAFLGYEISGFLGYEQIGAVLGAVIGSAFNYFKFSD